MLNPGDYLDIKQPWFAPDLKRQDLKKILKRDNRHALVHFGLWLTLLGGLGFLAVKLFLASSWWALPTFLAYGVIYSSNNARWHECSHGTCFKSDWLNRFFYWLCGSMEFRDGIEFRWSHARHHSYTMISIVDPEIPLPRPPNLIKYFADYFYLWSGFYALRNLLLHSIGIVPKSVKNYVPEEEYRAMFQAARASLLPHLAVTVTALITGSWLPLLLFGLPRFYGCFVQWAFNGLQHAGMTEDVYDHRLSTRSFNLNPILSFLYINMEYHIEHHLYPLVPWHQLPKLNSELKDQLPIPYQGLVPALRECMKALLRQRIDVGYNIPRHLPPTQSSNEGIHVETVTKTRFESTNGRSWMRAGTANEIKDEEMILLRAGDRHILVYSGPEGFCATDGLCTHEQAPLINGKLDGSTIECPKHNARFHICTGKVLRRPAKEDLLPYPVKEEGGVVFVELPF